MTDSLAHQLEALERELLTPATRRDHARLDLLLAPEFREFGSSGRSFTRDTIIAELQQERITASAILSCFACQQLSPTVALLTYTTSRIATSVDPAPRPTLRSSIWVEREGRWQLLFHQGTRIDAPTP